MKGIRWAAAKGQQLVAGSVGMRAASTEQRKVVVSVLQLVVILGLVLLVQPQRYLIYEHLVCYFFLLQL